MTFTLERECLVNHFCRETLTSNVLWSFSFFLQRYYFSNTDVLDSFGSRETFTLLSCCLFLKQNTPGESTTYTLHTLQWRGRMLSCPPAEKYWRFVTLWARGVCRCWIYSFSVYSVFLFFCVTSSSITVFFYNVKGPRRNPQCVCFLVFPDALSQALHD